jgi:uncharacterized protein (DUF58 family)
VVVRRLRPHRHRVSQARSVRGVAAGAVALALEEGIPVAGEEEFNMLRAYRAGDAPRQIAWKALAREQGLLTKEFSAMASSELWIDWEEAQAPISRRGSRSSRIG